MESIKIEAASLKAIPFRFVYSPSPPAPFLYSIFVSSPSKQQVAVFVKPPRKQSGVVHSSRGFIKQAMPVKCIIIGSK